MCINSLCSDSSNLLTSYLPSVPSPPLSLMVVDADSSTVSLVWFPPTEPNGILLFYRVLARQLGSNRGEIVVSIAADMPTSDMVEFPVNNSDLLMVNTTEDWSTANDFVSFTLTGLSPHTVYVITVQANTSAGFGNRSKELHMRTDPGASRSVCVCMCICVCIIIYSPSIPSTEADIVSIVVPAVVVPTVMAVAVPAIVVLTALLCHKWRKKTAVPVGGTQDRGKPYHATIPHCILLQLDCAPRINSVSKFVNHFVIPC